MSKIFIVLTNITNCILTIGIVVFAYLQWKCSDMQRETELFKYRIQHIQDLKAIWEEINQNIEVVTFYDILGHLCYSGILNSDRFIIGLRNNQLYVVQIGKHSVKLKL